MFNPNDDSSVFSYTLIYLFKNTYFQSTVSHNAHQQHSFVPFQTYLCLTQLPPYLNIILQPKSSAFALSEDKKIPIVDCCSPFDATVLLGNGVASYSRSYEAPKTLELGCHNITSIIATTMKIKQFQTKAHSRSLYLPFTSEISTAFNITFEVNEFICWTDFKYLQSFTRRQLFSYLGTSECKHTKYLREFCWKFMHHHSGRFTPFIGGNFSGNIVARVI